MRLKTLMLDASSGFYRISHHESGQFFGPVDLGLHLAHKHNSLNIGTGIFAGSIFPGSNRLIFNGISPCWHGFFISSMGGAGLVFDNLGINLLSIVGKSTVPSLLYLNRDQGEEIRVELFPLDLARVWQHGRKGVYGLMEFALEHFGSNYSSDPRILATGPASLHTDFGAIASAPVRKGTLTPVDTWAGRGGFGTKMLRDHGIAGVIYGGTHVDDDFRDRKVADKWFQEKYNQHLAAKDFEATTKYRFDPKFDTGGTLGINFKTVKGDLIAFNYRSIYWPEEERLKLHQEFILDHYLKQFNEETIQTKQQKNCGEPCVAVCKKMNGIYKKDYEPYQTMGPLCGIFDQRAAELLNHEADTLGFDAISVGGVIAWLMECLHEGFLQPDDLGVKGKPVFSQENFDLVRDSMHNASLGLEMLKEMVKPDGKIPLQFGARKLARQLAREKGQEVMDCFAFNAFARQGWIVPNQYWTPGAVSPVAIMGKYYMNYGKEFIPPRELGKANAERMVKELMLDNLGICRFHRAWAEELMPHILEELFGCKDAFMKSVNMSASRITSRNASVFFESQRTIDLVHTFLKKKNETAPGKDPVLSQWLGRFQDDPHHAALDFWYDIHKGLHESLREFPF
ncbi:MAG: aldehyde ferredoxin oxidoreductase N-terminal domain-containing protein [Bacteroidales bacterium]